MIEKERYALLTVDIWDTLLRRRCHPDCVKLHTARYVLTLYGNRLPPENRDAWTLMRIRQMAEKQIGDRARAEGLDDEYNLFEVYDLWLTTAGLEKRDRTLPGWEGLIQSIANVEIEQEKLVSYADPTIHRTLREIRADNTLFLSDFYMPSELLRELLCHKGLNDLVEDGWSSCDSGYNKRSGRLYRHLHKTLNIKPVEHIHVGDNTHSDIAAARKLGIQALHFQPDEEHEKRQALESNFNSRSTLLEQTSVNLATIPNREKPTDLAYEFGRRTSLLWIGFILHIMQEAIKDGVGHLYFFTREGEFFHRIYQKLASENPIAIQPPPTTVLEVSRIATFAASLNRASSEELMRLWTQYSTQTPRALLASLDINPDDFQASLKKHELGLDEPVHHPWKDQRIKQFLEAPKNRAKLDSHLRSKREELLEYLNDRGLDTNKPHKPGIVDIGWRGTIQDNLAHTLPGISWRGYYLALNKFLNKQPPNATKNAWGPDLNVDRNLASLLESVAPMEMLCNSPNGSVTGYKQGPSGMEAVRLVDDHENAIFNESIHHYQEGVIDSIPFWAELIRVQAFSAKEIQPAALKIWQKIINDPPPFLAQAYFRLNHNEMFGVGGFSNKATPLTTLDIIKAPYSKTHRNKTRDYLKQIGWLPGVYANPNTDRSFKLSLQALLKILELRNRLLRR